VINGVLRSTLCRDHSYRFIKLGQLLERADMTTRIIDVGTRTFLDKEGAQHAIEHLLWGTLLKSLSALGAYRRMIGPQVEKNAAVDFVFMEPTFPRSVRFCIRELREELGQLATTQRRCASSSAARRKLRGFEATAFEDPGTLHAYIDELQLLISDLHGAIRRHLVPAALMRRFSCDCGSPVYFENDYCINCSQRSATIPSAATWSPWPTGETGSTATCSATASATAERAGLWGVQLAASRR
jgi:uncharacterized alpha-E superfamily protein